jgi:two-component system, chemotaxis family, protein-glutamate methylesterase/glutaminase
MRKIRVLVVDDSVVVRRVLAREFSGDSQVELVGTAPNGRVALAKIAQCSPDLVTLDVEMPEMDGLKTLAALREMYPDLPVIMFSAFGKPRSSATLETGLAFPGVDYVLKPAESAGLSEAVKVIREDLLPKIRMYSSLDALPAPPPSLVSPSSPDRARSVSNGFRRVRRVDIVVIGASTGGPDALARLLPCFPEDFPVPILIVQHMPPPFMKALVDRLASQSKIEVAEGHSHQPVVPRQALLAPGGLHMRVENGPSGPQIRTDSGPPEHSCRPSVDILFRSAAEVYGAHVLAVMMTGMGQDGLDGCKKIRNAGGQILVQDQATSVVWGMPRLVAEAGLVDEVLPLSKLGDVIVRRVTEPLRVMHPES